MSGYARFNFDSFYAAEETLKALGWNVINPARLDEEEGFDPDTDEATEEFMKAARKRDLLAILESDAIALLPGWQHSVGARAELGVANWCKLEILDGSKLVTSSPVEKPKLP